ncbi:MAG: HI0074 family nucleotidyltransferase substrate-binding subunit [Bacteroidota bacterium]
MGGSWKQSFLVFERLYFRLNDALKLESLTDIEKAGILHWYEITFELGWKTLKDYLQEMGIEVRFPRDTIKEAFKNDLIQDGDLWNEMLEKRNLMSHTYDEFTANQSFQLVRDEFIHGIEQLYTKLKELR